MKRAILNSILLLSLFYGQGLWAHEYAPGIHQWQTKGGTIIVISGLVTNNQALYVHNYNFYFQREGENGWYQIPLLDKSKPGTYELSVTSKAKDERMVKDMRLEIREKQIYLLRAQSTRDDDLNDSPITVTRYRLVAGDGDDWPYFFERTSSKTYPTMKDIGVDVVLKKEAQQIK
jgi:hypothetical protein